MMDYYKGTIPIYEPANARQSDVFFPKDVGFGYVPRDREKEAPEDYAMFSPPSEMQVIPRSEWDARYDEQERTKSSLEHRYLSGPNGTPIWPHLDQNGEGFCWAYSPASAIMLNRARQGLPYVRLSAHAVACKIKGFRDEGGWCGLSAKFAREQGYPSVDKWPEQSMSRQYDNAATWENAALNKVTDEWVDLTQAVYDQNLTTDQLATCGFLNHPAPSDFNWWAHSVCQVRWVRIEAGSWGPLILNQWKGWGRYGLAVLRGSQAIANGAIAIRGTTISMAA